MGLGASRPPLQRAQLTDQETVQAADLSKMPQLLKAETGQAPPSHCPDSPPAILQFIEGETGDRVPGHDGKGVCWGRRGPASALGSRGGGRGASALAWSKAGG